MINRFELIVVATPTTAFGSSHNSSFPESHCTASIDDSLIMADVEMSDSRPVELLDGGASSNAARCEWITGQLDCQTTLRPAADGTSFANLTCSCRGLDHRLHQCPRRGI